MLTPNPELQAEKTHERKAQQKPGGARVPQADFARVTRRSGCSASHRSPAAPVSCANTVVDGPRRGSRPADRRSGGGGERLLPRKLEQSEAGIANQGTHPRAGCGPRGLAGSPGSSRTKPPLLQTPCDQLRHGRTRQS